MASITRSFVPAWKRLGLKLKSGGLSTPPAPGNSTVPSEAVPTRTNKRKAAAITNEEHSPHVHQHQPSLKRKKSVSFSAEVKAVDGDITQHAFKDWASKQKGGEGEFTPTEAAEFQTPKAHPANQNPAIASPEASKQNRKPKGAEVDTIHIGTPAYVTYLQQFHTAREQWRFNKARQSQLLKNIFNVFRVPPEHDDALKSYLEGLQGQAARERLTQTARDILNNTTESTGSPEDETMTDNIHKEARDSALRSQLKGTKSRLRNQEAQADSQSEDRELLVRKRRRAELILKGLGADQEGLATRSSTAEDSTGPAGTRKRTRRPKKSRTGVPDDDDTDETSSVSSVPSSTDTESGDEQESDEESEESSDASSSTDSNESSDEDGSTDDGSDSDQS